jgi:hypothetical protein
MSGKVFDLDRYSWREPNWGQVSGLYVAWDNGNSGSKWLYNVGSTLRQPGGAEIAACAFKPSLWPTAKDYGDRFWADLKRVIIASGVEPADPISPEKADWTPTPSGGGEHAGHNHEGWLSHIANDPAWNLGFAAVAGTSLFATARVFDLFVLDDLLPNKRAVYIGSFAVGAVGGSFVEWKVATSEDRYTPPGPFAVPIYGALKYFAQDKPVQGALSLIPWPVGSVAAWTYGKIFG